MLNEELPRQLVQGLSGAVKGLRLYPMEHPALRQQLETLEEGVFNLLRGRELVRLGLLEGTLFVEDHLFIDELPAALDLTERLEKLELEGIEFCQGVRREELAALVNIFNQARSRGAEEFKEVLKKSGVKHIRPVAALDEEEDDSPREVYNRALDVVNKIFHDVRMGEVPSSEEVTGTVKNMVHMTLNEPHALFAMSLLKDFDNYTFTHSVNVAVLALTVGRACGLDENRLKLLGAGAMLHDIGKLEVDWEIINKPGRLTEEEFEQIKQHPAAGAEIVAQMEGMDRTVIDIVLCHHLHHDRKGYPASEAGRKFSPLVDMAAIADTYDAMTTLRSYQRPMTPRSGVNRLREIAGGTLHPQMVDRFIRFLGPYPVGTLVRLDSNEIGLVTWVGTEEDQKLRLKMLYDAEGEFYPEPPPLDLAGSQQQRIVAEVDPFLKGIEVTDYL